MASGVSVSTACQSAFQDLKLSKNNLKYIIFNLSKDLKEIVVEKSSTASDYDEFVKDLPEDDCRWAVYDLEYEKASEGKRKKLCFVSWSPVDARVKSKMVFASSRDALKRSLDGIAVEIQATDPSEISYETVLSKARLGTH